MYYRRKLPHCHPDLNEANFLFVTWRLAGSIPAARRPLPPVATPASAGRTCLAFDREVDKAAFGPVWLRCSGSCHGGRALDTARPNAISISCPPGLLCPTTCMRSCNPKTPLPVITRWLKGSTAQKANLILGRTGTAFWQDESFDHRVAMKRNWTGSFATSSVTRSAPVWWLIQAIGFGGVRSWQAKAPAPQFRKPTAKCRNSRGPGTPGPSELRSD